MNLIQKVDYFLFAAKVTIERKFKEFLYDEQGDTNFISILILLGIGLALAGTFLLFQEKIMNWVDTQIGGFFDSSVKGSNKTGK